jgi:hypothetical protein
MGAALTVGARDAQPHTLRDPAGKEIGRKGRCGDTGEAPPPARDERSNPIARWVRRPSIPIFHSERLAQGERMRKGGLIFVAERADP